ncbi:unnamed protein product, partial [Rotaria sordida]
LIATTAVNPADVIKTRIMCDSTSNNSLYKGPIDCVYRTMTREGPMAFMKGWLPNYLRIGPHTLVSLPLAEFIRKSFGADSF